MNFLDRQSIAVAVTTGAGALIDKLFNLYYLDVYLNVYHLEDSAFYFVHFLFAIWNAINDPILGWLSDKKSDDPLENRLWPIRIGGPMWCIVFLLPWFLWFDFTTHTTLLTLHFFVVMFLYDFFLTWVFLNHGALIADLSFDNVTRTRFTMAGCLFSLFVSIALFFIVSVFDRDDLSKFRILSVVVACGSGYGFYYTSSVIKTVGSPKIESTFEDDIDIGLFQFLNEIKGHSNFWWFILSNFLCIFMTTTHNNFATIFMYQLLENYSATLRSIIISLSAIIPPLIGLGIGNYVMKNGYYNFVKYGMIFRMFSGIVVYFAGKNSTEVLAIYLVLDPALINACFGYFTMMIADLSDEDIVTHSRQKSFSGMFFGMNALFTKPAISVAPTLGWYILSHFGYTPNNAADAELDTVVFNYMILSQVIATILFNITWSRMKLHSGTLHSVKENRGAIL